MPFFNARIFGGTLTTLNAFKNLRAPISGLSARDLDVMSQQRMGQVDIQRNRTTGRLTFEIDTGVRIKRTRTMGGRLSAFLDRKGLNGGERQRIALARQSAAALPKAVNELTKQMVQHTRLRRDSKLAARVDALSGAAAQAQCSGHAAGAEVGAAFERELQASVLSVLRACQLADPEENPKDYRRLVKARERLKNNLTRSTEALGRKVQRLADKEAGNDVDSAKLQNMRAMLAAMRSVRDSMVNYAPEKGVFAQTKDPRLEQTTEVRSQIAKRMTELEEAVSVCGEYRDMFEGAEHFLPGPHAPAYLNLKLKVMTMKEGDKSATIKASHLRDAKAELRRFPSSYQFHEPTAAKQYNDVMRLYQAQATKILTEYRTPFGRSLFDGMTVEQRKKTIDDYRESLINQDVLLETKHPFMCRATMAEKAALRDAVALAGTDATLEKPEVVAKRIKDRIDSAETPGKTVATRSVIAYMLVHQRTQALAKMLDDVPPDLIEDDISADSEPPVASPASGRRDTTIFEEEAQN